ncbi:CRISPR-associated helicase Cas3' [Streptacidiphilus sp. ASG 303]|nr:CRISPR-associated helicase Cas3' [Streptacidiphilus sp. ASG 303]
MIFHMLDSAAVALSLWDVFLAPSQRQVISAGLGLADDLDRARATVSLWTGLHDIGKLSPGFQSADPRGWTGLSKALHADLGVWGEKLGHAQAGMRCAPALLEGLGYPDTGAWGVRLRAAQIVGGHHGRFHAAEEHLLDSPCHLQALGGVNWAELRRSYTEVLHRLLGAPAAPAEVSTQVAVLVTGLVILADWLVSQEHYLRARQKAPISSVEEHWEAASAACLPLLEEAGLVPVDLGRTAFVQAHGIPQPNALQRSVLDELPAAVRGPGILLVTAATGDGKTETALESERILAESCGTRGFAFLLPTMATSDQMYERVNAFVRRQCTAPPSVTLTHSMAWLNPAYSEDLLQTGPAVLTGEIADQNGSGSGSAVASRWLRGGKRPLLAQFAVGTIDQALMAVLPVKHNALRMLALSGKTFIVDEAHAYDPYMQVLLGRLLHWLGAYRCPVVLLSATLPVSVSDRLIKEYLRGAGATKRELRDASFRSPYPGWLFVDAATRTATCMSGAARTQQTADRRTRLALRREAVRHVLPASDRTADRLPDQARLQRIEDLLQPLMTDQGGCALVVCTTVADAQQTYSRLRTRLCSRLGPGELELLHARLPGDDRAARTTRITSDLGRTGNRPVRRIVVATQVVEQSLDLDADLVISDLAPLALLLQRAGRCWRHEGWWARHGRPGGRDRPAWAQEAGPQLVVLDPLDENGAVPPHWGEVYDTYLLQATARVIVERDGTRLNIPEEVQDLVEQVHGDGRTREGQPLYRWDEPELAPARLAYEGGKAAMETAGRCVAIPRVKDIAGLEALHRFEAKDEEWDAATRLGADSVRVLCCYVQPDGCTTLDVSGARPLPLPGQGRLPTSAEVRAVMERTIPVQAAWMAFRTPDQAPPQEWAQHTMLSDLVLLRHEIGQAGPAGVQVGNRTYHLDTELGLVRT